MNKLAVVAITSLLVFAGCGSTDQPTTQKQPIIVTGPAAEDTGDQPCEESEEEEPEGPQCLPLGAVCYLDGPACCAGSTCMAEPMTTAPTKDLTIVHYHCLGETN